MYVTINDITLYYEKYGNKKFNILILPGWGNTRKTFDYMINFLKNFATIYIIDFPGFGKTKFPSRDLTIYDYANLIKDFISYNSISNYAIISHSFGTRISLILCGMLNSLNDKLIIIDGAGIKEKKKLHDKIKTIIYKILKKLKILLPRKIKNKYLNKLNSIFGSTDYNNLDNKMKNTFIKVVNEDLTYLLRNIKQETLLIWGENDLDTPLESGKIMEQLLDNGTLITLKNTGHFSYLENPVLVNKIIFEFLKNDFNL